MGDSDLWKPVAEKLTQELYKDSKGWLVSLWRQIAKVARRSTQETVPSISALLEALAKGDITSGTEVTVDCKPVPFGPFLRQHYLPFISGMRTDLRLGPQLTHTNPMFALMGQLMSHYTPVGLYPAVGDGVVQGSLYENDASVFGISTLVPQMAPTVPRMAVLLGSRHSQFFGRACHVRGRVQLVSVSDLERAGFEAEDHEALRQQGVVWFVDATGDDSRVTPLADGVVVEMWGALYAEGHLEIEGQLEVKALVEGYDEAMKRAGFPATIQPNQGKAGGVSLFAKGARVHVGTDAPLFSVHMDADLATEYDASRRRFDRLSNEILLAATEVCSTQNVRLANPLDFDFSYTDSGSAFSVLRSCAAERISDPIAMAIRDWHRGRSDHGG